LDVSSLDFSGDITVSSTIGGETIDVAAATYADASGLATAINGAISTNGNLPDVTAEVSDDGNSVVFKNAGLTDVAATIDISDATGTQNTTTGADVTGVNQAAGATALTVDTSQLTLDDDGVTGSFDVDDGTGNSETITFSVPAGTNGPAEIAAAINTALGSATNTDIAADLTVTVATDDLTIANSDTSTSGLSYGVSNISISDGGTANASVGSSVSTLAPALDQTVASQFEAGETISFSLDVAGTAIEVTDASNLQDVVAQINGETKNTGVSGFLSAAGDEIVFASAKGENFTATITTDVDSDATTVEVNQSINTATDANANVSLNSLDISTRGGSDQALVAIDFAIDQVNQFRSDLGAVQNRFESTIANLSTSVENLSAANSRIVDADFASETAALAKSQVLQQAGISVLAQANARPQQVLSLLQ
jgi:flagellin